MQQPIYFPGLNTLRIYAAVCVIISHVAPTHELLTPLLLDGSHSVTLFFALSGFLITYLLMDERQRTGRIDVRAFYVRRALRIWPLYFLVVVVSYIAASLFFPYQMPPTRPVFVLAILVLLPQVPDALAGDMGALGQLWSIGVEEIFYLYWPVLVRRFRIVPLCLTIIAVRLALSALVSLGIGERLAFLLYLNRWECMAVGALGAWLVFMQHPLLRILYRPQVQIAAILAAIYVIAQGDSFQQDLLVSIVFTVLIVNIAANPRSLLRLETPLLRSLGNISYSVYMWHVLVLLTVVRLTTDVTLRLGVIVVVSILIGFASYRWIERPLMRLKYRFGAAGVSAPTPLPVTSPSSD